jgi:hypothetical protein
MKMLRAELDLIDPVRLVQWYIWVLGAGLLLDGGLLLLADWLGVPLPFNASDWRDNVLHIVWGLALLAVSWLSWRRHRPIWVAWAAVIFGAFSVALGVLGLTIDQPLGLQLGPGENAFYFIVGPAGLLLGGWALRTLSLEPVALHSGAQQGERRNGQVSRRHPRRRRGKTRGRGRGHPSR